MLLLLFIVFVFICWCCCYVLVPWLRLRGISANIYSVSALPLIGHIHLLPTCRYEWTNFLTNYSSRALRDGHPLIRWWILNRMSIWALDAETTKMVLENSVELRKGFDYAFFRQWLGQGLLLSDGDKWRRQRRMLTNTFHFAMLEQYSHTFNDHAKLLLNRLSELGNKDGDVGVQLDIGPTLIRCSLDIVAEAIMGVQLDSTKAECRAYVSAIKKFNDLAHIYNTNPCFAFIPITWRVFGHAKETKQCVDTLKQFTRGVIEQRIKIRAEKATAAEHEEASSAEDKKGRRKMAFLDLLLEMEDTLDREELREQVDTFMFEGHDTTAHGLTWTLWCLATHQQCQRQLHEEIVQHLGVAATDKNGFGPRGLSMSDVNELRYLDRCVKEALRLFPPVPVLERDLVNDTPLGAGRVAPRGAMMLVSPLIVHHNEQVYPRHLEFNPDHFLPEAISARNPYDYIPFSAGPRNCIGQRFALLEMKILLAHIFWHFRLTTDIPFCQNRPALEAILRPELGLPVQIHKISNFNF